MKHFKIGIVLLSVSFSVIILAIAVDLIMDAFTSCSGYNYIVNLMVAPLLFFLAGIFFVLSLFERGRKVVKTSMMLFSFFIAFIMFTYFSTIDPNICVPDRCVIAKDISCTKGFLLEQTEAKLRLENMAGKDIIIKNMTIWSSPISGLGDSMPHCISIPSRSVYNLPVDGSAMITFSCNPPFLESKRKVKATILIYYTLSDDQSGFVQNTTGYILTGVGQ